MPPLRPLCAPVLVLAVALAAAGCGNRSGPTGAAAGEACASAAECRAGLLCFSRRCAVSAPPSPGCTLPHTPTVVIGEVAGPPSQPAPPNPTCVLPVRAPQYPGVLVQELGVHAVGTPLQFQIPAGTTGFSIVSQEVEGSAVDEITFPDPEPAAPPIAVPNSVVPTDVLRPDTSAKFYDDFVSVPEPAQALAYYGGFTPSQGAFTVPNTTPALELVRSEGQLPPGTWSLTVNDFARECPSFPGCGGGSTSGRYDVKVLARAGPLAATGTLDVELYVVTADHRATALAADPRFARYVSDLATILGRAGVCLGTVTLHDVPDWARTEYASVNVDGTAACDPLSLLFTLAVDRNAIHLFLVDDLVITTTNGDFTLLGLDGSIPGPSGVPGTVNSGAAVVFSEFAKEPTPGACAGDTLDIDGCGVDLVAYVSAHEAGHWLGLYHTTEQEGSLFDPLSDTPTCACSRCAPRADRTKCAAGGATVTAETCRATSGACAGGGNLMFWLLDGSHSRGALSLQQGEVVRLNPAVR